MLHRTFADDDDDDAMARGANLAPETEQSCVSLLAAPNAERAVKQIAQLVTLIGTLARDGKMLVSSVDDEAPAPEQRLVNVSVALLPLRTRVYEYCLMGKLVGSDFLFRADVVSLRRAKWCADVERAIFGDVGRPGQTFEQRLALTSVDDMSPERAREARLFENHEAYLAMWRDASYDSRAFEIPSPLPDSLVQRAVDSMIEIEHWERALRLTRNYDVVVAYEMLKRVTEATIGLNVPPSVGDDVLSLTEEQAPALRNLIRTRLIVAQEGRLAIPAVWNSRANFINAVADWTDAWTPSNAVWELPAASFDDRFVDQTEMRVRLMAEASKQSQNPVVAIDTNDDVGMLLEAVFAKINVGVVRLVVPRIAWNTRTA